MKIILLSLRNYNLTFFLTPLSSLCGWTVLALSPSLSSVLGEPCLPHLPWGLLHSHHGTLHLLRKSLNLNWRRRYCCQNLTLRLQQRPNTRLGSASGDWGHGWCLNIDNHYSLAILGKAAYGYLSSLRKSPWSVFGKCKHRLGKVRVD